jgi:hypothetical protein
MTRTEYIQTINTWSYHYANPLVHMINTELNAKEYISAHIFNSLQLSGCYIYHLH